MRKLLKVFAMVFVSVTLALGCLTLVGCGDEEIQVKSISLNKDTLSLMEGQAETLIVTLDPNNADITWTSSDTTKVTVDINGKVTGISATTSPVIVTATAGDKSDTCAVTVTRYVPTYELSPTINFSIDELSVESGFKYTEETNLKDNIIFITANTEKSPNIAVSSGGYKFGPNEDVYFKSVKTQGKGSKETGSIKLVLSKAAKIVLYCRNSSSSITEMPVSFFNVNYEKMTDQTYNAISKEKTELTFTTTQAGTYYIGTETGSLDIYGVLIYYAV